MKKISKMGHLVVISPRIMGWHKIIHYVCLFWMGVVMTILPSHVAWAKPSIEVQVIEASKNGQFKVSPELKRMRVRLESTFKKFSQFSIVSSSTAPLVIDKKNRFNISKDLELFLTIEEVNKRGVTLKMEIPKRSMKHTVKAKSGKLFFEALKWKGKVYLIAITPKP